MPEAEFLFPRFLHTQVNSLRLSVKASHTHTGRSPVGAHWELLRFPPDIHTAEKGQKADGHQNTQNDN